jgi:hypothetical protein
MVSGSDGQILNRSKLVEAPKTETVISVNKANN